MGRPTEMAPPTEKGASLHADVSATLQPGFSGTTVPGWLATAHAEGLVSVCLYGANVSGSAGLVPACRELLERLPGVLLAVDEEGGDVTRLHYPAGSPSVGNAVLGRIDALGTTAAAAAQIGAELAALGIGLNLAPVVDVNSSPENPVIGVRSFGPTATLVNRHSAAWVRGLQEIGVAACAKHFPGHGDTSVDSHHGLPRITVSRAVLHQRELAPFRAAVDAGVACVMTSHIVVDALDPDRPATFSPTVLGVLRGDLGFSGVIVSDALDMAGASAVTGMPEAAVLALLAGVDLLCLGSQTEPEEYAAVHAAVLGAVASGRLPAERVSEAADRVRALAARSTDHLGSRSNVAAHEGTLTDEQVAATFTTSHRFTRWRQDPAPSAVVQVESGSNLAVGAVGWGPRSVGVGLEALSVPPGAKVAVAARSLSPDHPAHQVLADLRGRGHHAVLIECGWPRGGADVETYGGSPAVARALVALLGVERTDRVTGVVSP
ncbi:MAG: glycoside hydrolase family 3 N-terminal domain-containing protein [Ornithinibacter sp.]